MVNTRGKEAVRPALRVLDHDWGRPPEHVVEREVPVPTTVSEIEQMSTPDLLELLRRNPRRTVASEGTAADESVASAAGNAG